MTLGVAMAASSKRDSKSRSQTGRQCQKRQCTRGRSKSLSMLPKETASQNTAAHLSGKSDSSKQQQRDSVLDVGARQPRRLPRHKESVWWERSEVPGKISAKHPAIVLTTPKGHEWYLRPKDASLMSKVRDRLHLS
jgi:hypothetical protein